MEDEEAESTIYDIRLYSDGIALAIREEKYEEAIEYANKMKKKLEDIVVYADRKKVAF